MINLYGASKLKHAELWRQLSQSWYGVRWTARWPYLHVGGVPEEEAYAKIFWQHDLEDIQRSDGVIVYAEPEDDLKGALVEAGMALALGKFVIVVGENHNYSTWQYHPLVYRVATLDKAELLVKCMILKLY